MKLTKRVLFAALAITVVFASLFLVLIGQHAHTVDTVNDYTQTMDEPRAAIEHLLTTIYSDFLLVEEYLLITEYSTLEDFNVRLHESEEACEAITDSIDAQIEFGTITDPQIIEHYQTALVVYSSWQRSRDTLLKMHREAVVSGVSNVNSLRNERRRFVTLMKETSNHFIQSLEGLNTQQLENHSQLAQSTQRLQQYLVALLIVFIIAATVSIVIFTRALARPLDEMGEASRQFTQGNYKTRVPETSSIPEISALQRQLNRVYALIDSTFHTKAKKKEASKQLLPNQYRDVLDFVRQSHSEGKMPTIKDVKKHLDLTHPTVISRLRYLEENGYIEMHKDGRNKYITEL